MENIENQIIDNETFIGFCNRLSGKNEGNSKAEVMYQSFALEDDIESRDRKTFYNLSNCVVNISRSRLYPQYVSLDLIFGSSDDPELKLLWGRLQRQKKNEQEHPEKTWIFSFTIVERASVIGSYGVQPVLAAYLNNPLMTYITRELPSMMAEERIYNGELVGGNIVRMLIPAEYVSFEVSQQDLDSFEVKVAAEMRDEEFINNYNADNSGANWN